MENRRAHVAEAPVIEVVARRDVELIIVEKDARTHAGEAVQALQGIDRRVEGFGRLDRSQRECSFHNLVGQTDFDRNFSRILVVAGDLERIHEQRCRILAEPARAVNADAEMIGIGGLPILAVGRALHVDQMAAAALKDCRPNNAELTEGWRRCTTDGRSREHHKGGQGQQQPKGKKPATGLHVDLAVDSYPVPG